MKLLYTNESPFLVNNAKNIIEQAGFEVVLKNEFAAGAAGDLSPFDTWLELWLTKESDFLKAKKLLDTELNKSHGSDWFCQHCHERNDAAFEICWQCQQEAAS